MLRIYYVGKMDVTKADNILEYTLLKLENLNTNISNIVLKSLFNNF